MQCHPATPKPTWASGSLLSAGSITILPCPTPEAAKGTEWVVLSAIPMLLPLPLPAVWYCGSHSTAGFSEADSGPARSI